MFCCLSVILLLLFFTTLTFTARKRLSSPAITTIAVSSANPTQNVIQLLVENVTFPRDIKYPEHQEESYSLTVDPMDKIITIKSPTEVGLFYGAQSLLSMISPMDININESAIIVLPAVHIADAPRFRYRGLMLDVSRNFFHKDEIFKIIDTLAMYKMNKLHLHLSDDQGWRLEIPALPELTEVS